MPFYVPLGPRGLLFRVGTLINNLVGWFVYARACRRRALTLVPIPVSDGEE